MRLLLVPQGIALAEGLVAFSGRPVALGEGFSTRLALRLLLVPQVVALAAGLVAFLGRPIPLGEGLGPSLAMQLFFLPPGIALAQSLVALVQSLVALAQSLVALAQSLVALAAYVLPLRFEASRHIEALAQEGQMVLLEPLLQQTADRRHAFSHRPETLVLAVDRPANPLKQPLLPGQQVERPGDLVLAILRRRLLVRQLLAPGVHRVLMPRDLA
ncbi:MAG: hypothetical protein GY711_23930, partial [bacterium]|nr:hypothetical protein [bacterium]